MVALVICAAPALAEEQFTAYDALRMVGVHINRDAVNHIVSVTGTRGSPQPQTWRVSDVCILLGARASALSRTF